MAGLLLLSACSSASSSSAAPAAVALATGASTAYPTQDVVAPITADSTLKAELASADPGNNGTLTLGTSPFPGLTSMPHNGTLSDGTVIGADVDLRNAVAKLLGISWNVQDGTFATIIPGVQNGKYQVGQDNFGVTTAREQVVDFATYLTDGQSFLAPADSKLPAITKVTDLCGQTIGTTAGSTFQQILTKDAPQCAAAGKPAYTVDYYSDDSAIWLGLANGRLDLYFGATLNLKYDSTHVANVKFLSQFSSTNVGFVTAKGSPLAKVLSDAVNELITSGDYAKILDKWGINGSGVQTSQVNPAANL
ncbi:MAG TPA: transporter substrate-binding domain-containing protein [Actinocrinis sp.]|nr:transporter substrate-binding domain-containing protein [Actinocrinis sp.]